MSYSDRMQRNHLYSVLLSPRGAPRMVDQGKQIAQQFLSPFDLLIGLVGDSGSGKSILLQGMFPGLELTNDDEGVNVRPLPIMDLDDTGFFKPHTYHLDIRFEQAFYQLAELADAIRHALGLGKRVVVEHFDLIYEQLGLNA
ncbi:MAG: alanine-tRNA synthetase second additional domain-containing protein, partial [Clostridiaceae bacterium]|nr:alanine-tRNA synthetase second additional domain-containing protein [Clostridiaceae bacterium]